jgi:molecular chaperone GrpE (heat shock protein)
MDIIELEDALANFGVEPFEHPEGTFNPSSQKCISPVETHDRKLHRKIARRLLPGYQRQEKIIRKEYINIYVFKNNKITQKGGK